MTHLTALFDGSFLRDLQLSPYVINTALSLFDLELVPEQILKLMLAESCIVLGGNLEEKYETPTCAKRLYLEKDVAMNRQKWQLPQAHKDTFL